MSEHDICDGVIADKNECIAELEEDVARKSTTIARLLGLLREVEDRGYNVERECACCPVCGMQSEWFDKSPTHAMVCPLAKELREANDE